MDGSKRGGRMKIGEWHPTLRERDAGRWEVRWWADGRYIRRIAPSRDAAEAMAAAEVRRRERASLAPSGADGIRPPLTPVQRHALLLAAARIEAAGGRIEDLPEAVEEWIAAHLAAGRIALSEAVAAHVAELEALGRSPRTVADRRWRLGRLVAAVGDRPVAQLTRGRIADWVASGPPRGRRDMHAAASALCRWAWERGHLRRNPMESLRKPPRAAAGSPAILTPDAAAALLRAAQRLAPDMAVYFAVGLFAGLRPARELAGLRWEDVDLPGRRLYVPCGRAKTGRARAVPVSDNLAAWLDAVPAERRRGPVAAFSRAAFRRCVAAAGIAWTPDIMRHSRVSYRLAQGIAPSTVAAEGGHTADVMRRHYANLRIPPADVARFWALTPATVRKFLTNKTNNGT